jgi:hypothetical protein
MIVSFDDNVKATAFVDASGRTGMRQQLLHESVLQTIEEIQIAAGADISVARGACILETRSGMLPNALHGILRMSG